MISYRQLATAFCLSLSLLIRPVQALPTPPLSVETTPATLNDSQERPVVSATTSLSQVKEASPQFLPRTRFQKIRHGVAWGLYGISSLVQVAILAQDFVILAEWKEKASKANGQFLKRSYEAHITDKFMASYTMYILRWVSFLIDAPLKSAQPDTSRFFTRYFLKPTLRYGRTFLRELGYVALDLWDLWGIMRKLDHHLPKQTNLSLFNAKRETIKNALNDYTWQLVGIYLLKGLWGGSFYLWENPHLVRHAWHKVKTTFRRP